MSSICSTVIAGFEASSLIHDRMFTA